MEITKVIILAIIVLGTVIAEAMVSWVIDKILSQEAKKLIKKPIKLIIFVLGFLLILIITFASQTFYSPKEKEDPRFATINAKLDKLSPATPGFSKTATVLAQQIRQLRATKEAYAQQSETETAPPQKTVPSHIPSEYFNHCLDSSLWKPLSEQNQTYDIYQNGEEECLELSNWGIFTKTDQITILPSDALQGVVGIATVLPQNAEVEFSVDVKKLTNADLRFGVLEEVETYPPDKGALMVIRDGGYVDLYELSQGREKRTIVYTYPSFPGTYEYNFVINDSQLIIYRKGAKINPYQHLELPFTKRMFFIGFRIPAGGEINAEISGLRINNQSPQ